MNTRDLTTVGDSQRAWTRTDDAAIDAGEVWYSQAEVALSEALTARGFAFEQQKRIARGDTTAVLDFLVERTLVIEVDGQQHEEWRDIGRDVTVHTEHGFWILRVPAWKALYCPGQVVNLIALRLSELETRAEFLAKRKRVPDVVATA